MEGGYKMPSFTYVGLSIGLSLSTKLQKPEAITSKSTPLNSHFVLYSLINLRSTSTVSGVHANILRRFRRRRWSIGPFSFPFRFIAWLIKYVPSVEPSFLSRLSTVNWKITKSGECSIPVAKLLPSFRLGFTTLVRICQKPMFIAGGNVTVILSP